MAPGAQAAGGASPAQPPPHCDGPPPHPPTPVLSGILFFLCRPLPAHCPLLSATTPLLSVFPLLPLLPVGFRTKCPLRPGAQVALPWSPLPLCTPSLLLSPPLVYSPRQDPPLEPEVLTPEPALASPGGLVTTKIPGPPHRVSAFPSSSQVLLRRHTVGYLGGELRGEPSRWGMNPLSAAF